MQLKTTRLRTNSYAINKNGLKTNASKIDDIAFFGEAHTEQSFRKSILNLTVSESHPQGFAIHFTR